MAPTAFTPRYGAPEQFNKQRGATGPWTDVFALALVLVECVSGRKALEGDDPTQLYIASADPAIRPTLRSRGILVPDAVEAALHKALEVEPNALAHLAQDDPRVPGVDERQGLLRRRLHRQNPPRHQQIFDARDERWRLSHQQDGW